NVPTASGTYNYTLTVNIPGKPACTITKPVTLANVGVPNFNIADTTVCAEEPISVTIVNYNPLYTYRWIFFQTSFIASSATTLLNINPPTSGQYGIALEVTTPQGCIFVSPEQQVFVNKASFSGSLAVTPATSVCEGTPQTITFTPTFNTPAPTSIIWMKGNQQVGTGTSYVPTSSGSYWVKLVNAAGCQFTGIGNVNIIIRQRPYAAIVGSSSVCAGTQGTIQGVVTNPALQRRWLLNGSPMVAPYGTWATNTPLTINVPTASGTYNYTFEVRPATDTGCGSTASISVTVYPAVTPPVLNYNIVTCEPYVVQVTASGPSSGTYNWSTGAVGQTINVGYGGAVGVTYTAPSGCTASSDIMIPQPLERSLWIFPEGCYDVCYNTIPAPYILGPLGVFDLYKWIRNGTTVLTGTNSVIPQLAITQGGAYQLTIQNEGCNLESGIMTLVPNSEECEIYACSFKSDVKEETGYNGSVYLLNGYIQNTTASPITVTVTSFNNYGTYTPGAITVAPYSTYTFAPLQFTPNASFNGGNDIIVLQMPGCMTAYPVNFMETGQGISARLAVLSVVPNPAEESTLVSYDLGDTYKQAESLTVYNLLGSPVFTTKLDKPVGEINLSTLALPSGSYVVSIQADGVRAIQKILVKK
ncbi:MAG: T9SS type A sorting domain-containing protein, partial [Sphingobacteriales bacterium]